MYFTEIKQTLMDRRRQLEFSIYPYESHTRKLISKLMDIKELANNYITGLKRLETYRWSVGIGKLIIFAKSLCDVYQGWANLISKPQVNWEHLKCLSVRNN